MGYARSPFRDFESYFRTIVGLDEDVIRLILKQYNGKFITYYLPPGIYTTKNISEAVHPLGDHERTLQTKFDDNTKKTKLLLTCFGSHFGTLRFDEKSFFITSLGFTAYWDYKPNNTVHNYSPGVYTSKENFTLQYNR